MPRRRPSPMRWPLAWPWLSRSWPSPTCWAGARAGRRRPSSRYGACDGAAATRGVALLAERGVSRESVLVIRGDTLVTGDALFDDDDEIEVRPVVSGGATS